MTLKPKLRIPSYIALRFNLKIDNVYKGLLLGTGPIIDPGYTGKLSIPLHNLTNNNYTFTGGDKIIWVEFTKISTHPRRKSELSNTRDKTTRDPHVFIPYSESKRDDEEERNLEYHLHEALDDQPEEVDRVRSSIGESLKRARDASEEAKDAAIEAGDRADDAEDRAETARDQVQNLVSSTALATVLSLAVVVLGISAFFSVINNYHQDVDRVRKKLDSLEVQVQDLGGLDGRSPSKNGNPNSK